MNENQQLGVERTHTPNWTLLMLALSQRLSLAFLL